MIRNRQLSLLIKEKAKELGFDACGIARASAMQDHHHRLSQWLSKGYQAQMSYMEKNLDRRTDPRLLVPGAKSVIVLAMNYFHDNAQPGNAFYKVARYAWGRDYHQVIKHRLHQLAGMLSELAGQHQYRVFTDSAPVLERSWAQMAGLGTYGKNTCLILPRKGSFFFLGEIMTSLELTPDKPFHKDLCGTCTKCIEACPTNALVKPGWLDAGKCLSYLTIELKGNIPGDFRNKTRGWIFGCDSCQEVCPHNKHATIHKTKELAPLPAIATWNRQQWEAMTESDYHAAFKLENSAIARAPYAKLCDNIMAAASANP